MTNSLTLHDNYYPVESLLGIRWAQLVEPLLASIAPDGGVPLPIGDPTALCFPETTATAIMALYHTRSLDDELRMRMQERILIFKAEEWEWLRQNKTVDPDDADAWSGAGEPNVWSTGEAIWGWFPQDIGERGLPL